MSTPLVLVTGATGYLGHAVCRTLLERGWHVRALCRPHSSPSFTEEAIDCVPGDLTDPESLRRACQNVTHIVHLAARKSDEPDSVAVNVEGTRALIHAAKEAQVPYIVNVSTQSAKLPKRGVYGETKRQADELFMQSGLQVTTLRFSLIYGGENSGVFDALSALCRLPLVPVFGNGKALFAPIHRDDAAEAIVRALEHAEIAGNTFDVGGPQQLSFNALLGCVMEENGTKRPLIHIPVWVGLLAARVAALLPHPPLTRSNVLGGAQQIDWNPNPFLATTGLKPRPWTIGKTATTQTADAAVLLRYVAHDVQPHWAPSTVQIERYAQALQVHNVPMPHLPKGIQRHTSLLASYELAKRWHNPNNPLSQALLIAAGIYESQPESADTLLPKNQPLSKLFFGLSVLSIRAALVWIRALLFFPFLRGR